MKYTTKEELCADYPKLMKEFIFRMITRGKDDYEIDENYGEKGYFCFTDCLNFAFANKRYNVIKFINKDCEEDLYELPEQRVQSEGQIIKLNYSKFEVWLHQIDNVDAEAWFCNNTEYLSPDYFIISGLKFFDSYSHSDEWHDFVDGVEKEYPIEISLCEDWTYYTRAEIQSHKFDFYSKLYKERVRVLDNYKEMKEIYDYFIKLTDSFPDGDDREVVEFELDGKVYDMSSNHLIPWSYTLNEEYNKKIKEKILQFNPKIKNIIISYYYVYG